MAKAMDVAKFLIYLSSKDTNIQDFTNLKLQKLLYYSQGANVQINKKLLFEEDIEAWQFGPVVREVYKAFNSFGSMPITIDYENEVKKMNLQPPEIQAILSAWQQYSHYTAGQLVEMTHSEHPWKNAWHNNRKKIDKSDIRTTFDNEN